jgi:hypothetical protein
MADQSFPFTPPPELRALCAELLEVIEGEYEGTGLCYELRDRANAALATPPPEISEAEALAEWLYKRGQGMDLGTRDWYFRTSVVLQELAAVNAALATPPPELPTDQEIEKWADAATEVPLEAMDPDINGWQRCFTKEEFCASIRAALERWGK